MNYDEFWLTVCKPILDGESSLWEEGRTYDDLGELKEPAICRFECLQFCLKAPLLAGLGFATQIADSCHQDK